MRGILRANQICSKVVGLVLLLSGGCTNRDPVPSLEGPYLGQTPPGTTPEIFAPGFISTDLDELEAAFSPDGTELYLAVMAEIGSEFVAAIAMTKIENGSWTNLEIAPFSDVGLNMDPFVHPDGSKLYFTSTRPLEGDQAGTEDGEELQSNIWVMDREGAGWGAPRPIGPPINGLGNVGTPTVTRSGNMYFTRRWLWCMNHCSLDSASVGNHAICL